jgi:hypothetical protein
MRLANTITVAVLLLMSGFAIAALASTVEEHVPNGNTQLIWVPGFGTNRMLIGETLDPTDPAYANPSGDHTVGALTTATTDSGGIALSCTDPGPCPDYTWEAWFNVGDGSSRRGLVFRADPSISFMNSYQFVLYAGNAQLVFRKLLNQSPTTLASWIGPNIPGGIPAVNTWHHLKVEAIGSAFRLWWDDTELTGAPNAPIVDTTNPLTTGWVGVYNFRFDISNLTTYFDDLIMTPECIVPTKPSTWGQIKARYR